MRRLIRLHRVSGLSRCCSHSGRREIPIRLRFATSICLPLLTDDDGHARLGVHRAHVSSSSCVLLEHPLAPLGCTCLHVANLAVNLLPVSRILTLGIVTCPLGESDIRLPLADLPYTLHKSLPRVGKQTRRTLGATKLWFGGGVRMRCCPSLGAWQEEAHLLRLYYKRTICKTSGADTSLLMR
jgi:hypothetical protein